MTYILNKATKVIVIKSHGLPTMRLFPGYNRVADDVQNYFTTPAAKAYLDEWLTVGTEIPAGREQEADTSFDKNATLNEAQRVVNIGNPDQKVSSEVEDLRKKIADLETRLKKRK